MSKKKEVILACDPGAKGALVVISKKKCVAYIENLNDFGTMFVFMQGVTKKYEVVHCYLEKVHALSEVAATANFSFGSAIERCYNILWLFKIPYTLVSPAQWQKYVKLSKNKLPTKAYARKKEIKIRVHAIAHRKYPKMVLTTPRGRILDGVSDALMIGEEGKDKYLLNSKRNKK